MRFLFYIDNLNKGGAQKFCIQFAQYLSEEGHYVCILTNKKVNERIENLHYQQLTSVSTFGRLSELYFFLRKNNFFYIFSIMNTASLRIGLMKVMMPRLRFVAFERTNIAYDDISISKKLMIYMSLQLATFVACQTLEYAQDLRSKLPLTRTVLLPNCVKLDRNSKKMNAETKKDKIVLYSVGRLVKSKCVLELVHFMRALPPYLSEKLELHVFGDGPEFSEIVDIVSNRVLGTPVIKLHGWVDKEEIDWSKCDYLISVSSFEGFPNTFLEALNAGCPIVTRKYRGGWNELARDDYNAFVLSHENWQKDLFNVFTTIVNNRSIRGRMSVKGKKLVENYDCVNVFAKFCGEVGIT